MITITFPDGSKKKFEQGITALEIVKGIGEGLAKAALGAKANDELIDLTTPINEDAELKIITYKDEEGKEIFNHSATHILMHALHRLYKAIPGVGPSIEDGFYHDFDSDTQISADDLHIIEEEMNKIVKEDIKIERKVMPIKEAIKFLKEKGYMYTKELAEDLKEQGVPELPFYEEGDFINMCKGPHVPSTGYIKAFKLTKIAGAYWKGDAQNKQLQRVYGVAFPDKKQLKKHLAMLEEAEKRDHNKIGREMELFTTHSAIGQGLPLLMPKGARMIQLLQRFVEDEEEKRGYVLTKTPFMAKNDLYKISGHWDHYKDGMFIMQEKGETLALRPMTCPYQFMIYKNKQHSYRDLPIRYNETSTLFRNEASGEMHGLIRVRQFTLAEGHIVCTPEQLETEFKEALKLIQYFMKIIGIEEDVWYRFSKWDPKKTDKYIDNPKAWEDSQQAMKKILDSLKMDYEEADGEAAFYGPKLDIQFRNVFGKEDTIITIQIDFALPERFDMTYEGKDGKKHRPMVVHRSSIGCYERTLAMLIEKYAGWFPLWINPLQARVITVSNKFNEYAEQVVQELKDAGLRVDARLRAETTGKKVRDSQIEKVPILLTIGEKEVDKRTVAVRLNKTGKVKFGVKVHELIETMQENIKNKEIEFKL